MAEIDRWKQYWDKQTTPLHSYNNPFWYKLFADEINLLLRASEYIGGATLETACGNGALFPYLEINKTNYVGVDLSQTLIDIFKQNYPDLTLICGDASAYRSDKIFSLVLSNALVQYLNKQALHNYILNSMSLLDEKGVILMANIPWKHNRLNFLSGELASGENIKDARHSWIKIVKSLIWLAMNGHDPMGYYYNPRDFFKYKHLNADVFVYGSLFHPSRFSVVLKKK